MARAAKGFQPMLADPVEFDKLKFPVMGSPKLDGIRCTIRDGVAISRKLKPIPNHYIQESLHGLPDGLDGELIVGRTNASDVWNRSQSGVMSHAGEPRFNFWIFDHCGDGPFSDRFARASEIVREYIEAYPWLEIVPHYLCETMRELERYEREFVELGYEGIMIRSLDGIYKYGRSTAREGHLVKWKRFFDAEAEVIGFIERQQNTNPQERDERGYAKRSKAKAGMVGVGTLGALKCRSCLWLDGTIGLPTAEKPISEGQWIEFEIGGGFTDAQRAALWARRDTDLVGSIHKFKYQCKTPDGLPRMPVWLGERDPIDM